MVFHAFLLFMQAIVPRFKTIISSASSLIEFYYSIGSLELIKVIYIWLLLPCSLYKIFVLLLFIYYVPVIVEDKNMFFVPL